MTRIDRFILASDLIRHEYDLGLLTIEVYGVLMRMVIEYYTALYRAETKQEVAR